MPIASILTSQRASAVAGAVLFVATLTVVPTRTFAAGKPSRASDPFASTAAIAAAVAQLAPDGAASVISVRFDSLTENESFGELQQRSPWLAGLIERVERESGGTLADVARVTLSSRAGEQPLLAIEFRGPVSLEQRLRARCNSEPYRREAIGNVAFFAPQGRAAAWRTAFAQPNETTILAGPPRILADVMARSRTAILSPAMSDVIERLDYSLPLAAAFDLHDASDSPDALGSRTCFGVPRAMLRPISAIGVACSLNRDAAINARLVCDDPAAAADLRRSVNFGRGIACQTGLGGATVSALAEGTTAELDSAAVLVHWSASREQFFGLIGEPRRESGDETATEL